MFPTKISMATDGCAEALRAARMVKTVFERLDSELHPVRVAPTPDPGVGPGATLFDRNLRVGLEAAVYLGMKLRDGANTTLVPGGDRFLFEPNGPCLPPRFGWGEFVPRWTSPNEIGGETRGNERPHGQSRDRRGTDHHKRGGWRWAHIACP